MSRKFDQKNKILMFNRQDNLIKLLQINKNYNDQKEI